MAQTVFEKIVQSHAVGLAPGHEVRCGDQVTLAPDRVMTHDNSFATMTKFQALGARRVANPRQPVFTLDHQIQKPTPETLSRATSMADFARAHGIDHYPAGRGIGHQIMIEEGYVQPGGLCVASDSHSNTYGALGALGTPVVRTDAAVLWALGTMWWQVPPTIKVNFHGALRGGVTGKDVIITLCGLHNNGEVLNAVIEFGGDGVGTLSMEERLTIANMTTEWGALAGWFPVDEVTLAFMAMRHDWLVERGITDRITREMIQTWRDHPPRSDDDAWYAAEINLNLGTVSPHISGPHNLQIATSLAEVAARQIKIHKAYLVSCSNARRGDLRQAAAVLRGRKVHPEVEMYIAAASQPIQAEAQVDGSWGDLLAAGCRALPPGCGPCIGLGEGLLKEGEVGISATNRNFRGRMGSPKAEAYLASPAVVAASALHGYITGPEEDYGKATGPLDHSLVTFSTADQITADSTLLDGFPSRLDGRALLLPIDNLNTDNIYSKEYTYRDDMKPQQMAKVVMENHDPTFAGIVQKGDVLVSGRNFGTGSSREQAATALLAAGVAMVIAGSFSQTYLRNAINNGFICLECPTLSEAVLASPDLNDGQNVVVDDGGVTIDFLNSLITWRDQPYRFQPLGAPVQALIMAGGVENQVRALLGNS